MPPLERRSEQIDAQQLGFGLRHDAPSAEGTTTLRSAGTGRGSRRTVRVALDRCRWRAGAQSSMASWPFFFGAAVSRARR